MALAIVDNVRVALQAGQPLHQSDVLALCAVTEQLWAQTMHKAGSATLQHRRDYMRDYMRRYRAQRRTHALEQPAAIPVATS